MVTVKKVTSLGAILLLLIGAIVVSNIVSRSGEKKEKGPMFPDLKISDIAKVEIINIEGGVELTRVGTNWFVRNHIGASASTSAKEKQSGVDLGPLPIIIK